MYTRACVRSFVLLLLLLALMLFVVAVADCVDVVVNIVAPFAL